MNVSGMFARGVAMIGGTMAQARGRREGSHEPAFGSTPVIPIAKSQGSLMTLKMPAARGWAAGQTPIVAPGLQVNAFATDLEHPRWIEVLSNGDVLVAEARGANETVKSLIAVVMHPFKSIFTYAALSTMKRAGAVGVSANRITRLRDVDSDGAVAVRNVFVDGLTQPFGMALVAGTFNVGNTDGAVTFPYDAGTARATGPGRKLVGFKPGGHWTRSLQASPDGSKL